MYVDEQTLQKWGFKVKTDHSGSFLYYGEYCICYYTAATDFRTILERFADKMFRAGQAEKFAQLKKHVAFDQRTKTR